MTTSSPHPGGRVRPWFLAGSWCLIVLGTAHLVFMAVTLVQGPASAERPALRIMAGTSSSDLLGIPRNLLALFYGFSVAMALLAIAVGALNLVAERLAPEILTRGTGLIRLDLAISLLALVVAVLAFPPPAVIVLALGCTAYACALTGAVRTAHRSPA